MPVSPSQSTAAPGRIRVGPALVVLVGGALSSAALPASAQTAAQAENQELRALVEALRDRLATVEAKLANDRSVGPHSLGARPPHHAVIGAPVRELSEAAPTLLLPAPAAERPDTSSTTILLSGFIKADALFSRYNDGPAPAGSGRDFALPHSIPVGGSDEGVVFDAHAKQSRLAVATATPIGGDDLTTILEADFQAAPGAQGNERSTNAYNIALRRAAVSYRGWTVGQDWSTFQYVPALPESADLLGVTEGTAFVRQMLVRYDRPLSHGFSVQVALENAETTTLPVGASGVLDHRDDRAPDGVLRVQWKGSAGELSAAGVLRELRVAGVSGEARETAYGASLAGRVRMPSRGNDDLRFMISAGDGIGRYLGVGFAPDAVHDPGRNRLLTPSVTAGFIAYRHFWASEIRSTASASFQQVDNPPGVSPLANREAWSLGLNLFVSPLPRLDLGAEYRRTERVVEDGSRGSMDRLQFTAKQAF